MTSVSLALVLYVGVSILGNPDMISYESIYYMINDFNIAALSVGEDYTSLQYGYSFGENQVFGAYRDGQRHQQSKHKGHAKYKAFHNDNSFRL